MSLTRILRKLLTRSWSRGVSRVTAGLSSVGPPLTLMTIQLSANATQVGPSGKDNIATEHVGVEAPRALDVVRDDEVGQHNSLCRRSEFGHRAIPTGWDSYPTYGRGLPTIPR
jgi:hypothetical protein